MKPLFLSEDPLPKERSGMNILIERIQSILIPDLIKIGYTCEFQTVLDVDSKSLLKISQKGNPQSILVVPWVRPKAFSSSGITRIVADYPRLNIYCKNKDNDSKLKYMQELVKKYQLYFLVVLQRHNDNLYWIDMYQNIPDKFWELTYRKKQGIMDRIHFPKYKNYEFVNLNKFKSQLTQIFKV